MLLSPSTSCLIRQMATSAGKGGVAFAQQTTKIAAMTPRQNPLARMMHNHPLLCGGCSILMPAKRSFAQQFVISRFMSQIAEEGAGTHRPSAFHKKILVWAKMYPSVNKVPERVTRTQLKIAMDKFRVRASLFMVAGTFFFAAIFALIGRKERREGQSVTKMSLERTQASKAK